MKIINSTKYAVGQLFVLITIAFFASCKETQNEPTSSDTAQLSDEAIYQNNVQNQDAQFLVNAAEMNLEEIQFGKLAQQNGSTEHVKELGKLMEEAHTKSLDDLTGLAERKMITLPTSLNRNSQEAYIFLSGKSAADFDKAYSDKMVSGHENAITAFKKASLNATDGEIKNWAATSLPDLRRNLGFAKECQKKCAKK